MQSGRLNRVLPALMLGALLAWLALDFVTVAPNRILPGEGFSAFETFGWGGVLAVIAALLMVAAGSWGGVGLHSVLLVLVLLLMALPLALGMAASLLIGGGDDSARLGLGAGFWVLLSLLLLALVEVRTRLSLSRSALWAWMLPVVAGWWFSLSLWLNSLALWQEFQARSGLFLSALLQHLGLVGGAVGTSLVLALGLALAMRRAPTLRRLGFAALNLLQTVPSLALFGLLLVSMAWLVDRFPGLEAVGIRGIGWPPALLALVIYSLLPMVRNIYVALETVAPEVIESARAMGMSPLQVLVRVRLPLALPVILEGVRITTVQAIGLTAVAALIGAGGLGGFIFQGLGQAAMDLVLLGALPIVALALLADSLLAAVTERLQPGRTS